MSTVTVDFDDDVLALLRQPNQFRQPNQPVQETVKELIVMELYRRGAISSGKAAEILSTSRQEFIHHASRVGIPYLSMTADEWRTEVARSEQL